MYRFRLCLGLGRLIGAFSLALAALPALADFSGDVTVKLRAPGGTTQDATPVDLSQTVTVANLAAGVLAPNLGGTGAVSGFMLDNERIFFSGNAILLRVAVGDDTGGVFTTGYLGAGGQAARYEIGGLDITGQAITGFTVRAFDGFAASGFSGLLSPADPASLVQQLDAHTVSFNLDSLVFAHRPVVSVFAYEGESTGFRAFAGVGDGVFVHVVPSFMNFDRRAFECVLLHVAIYFLQKTAARAKSNVVCRPTLGFHGVEHLIEHAQVDAVTLDDAYFGVQNFVTF